MESYKAKRNTPKKTIFQQINEYKRLKNEYNKLLEKRNILKNYHNDNSKKTYSLDCSSKKIFDLLTTNEMIEDDLSNLNSQLTSLKKQLNPKAKYLKKVTTKVAAIMLSLSIVGSFGAFKQHKKNVMQSGINTAIETFDDKYDNSNKDLYSLKNCSPEQICQFALDNLKIELANYYNLENPNDITIYSAHKADRTGYNGYTEYRISYKRRNN